MIYIFDSFDFLIDINKLFYSKKKLLLILKMIAAMELKSAKLLEKEFNAQKELFPRTTGMKKPWKTYTTKVVVYPWANSFKCNCLQ